jgi:Flp pilus assembly protein TadD
MDGILDRSQGGATGAAGRLGISDDRLADLYGRQGDALLSARRYAEAEPLLREALRLRPDCGQLYNKLGSAVWEQGRPAESEPLFKQARELDPGDWHIHNNLGLAFWDQGKPAEASECYQTALKLNPAANEVRMNLGVVLSDLGRFEDALECLYEAVRLDPASPDTWQNLGMTLGRLGKWKEAIEYYNRALEIRPDYAEIHRNRAYGWLYMGDFERGWIEHEWRLKCRRHVGYPTDLPQWNGEHLGGRPILLHAEQGLGDTLQFIRYASVVRQLGGLVFVICNSGLLRIIARCPGVDMALDGSSVVPKCDVQASLMSMPAILRTTQQTVPNRVPYLPTEPILVERWRQKLAAALGVDPLAPRGGRGLPVTQCGRRPMLVGVAWQGSPKNPMDHFRSFPLASLAPVADLPGVRLVCVQAFDGLDQISALGGRFSVVELPEERPRTFMDTAALVSLLDVVITADTSVAHLTGGLGVPVWLALSTVGEWRWMLDREDCPWYPTMHIFRQTQRGDWDGVFRRMAELLACHLGVNPATAA